MMKLKSRFVLLSVVFLVATLWALMKLAEYSSSSSSNGRSGARKMRLRARMVNLNELQFIGECLVREAGEEIVRIRRENANSDARFALEKKADESPVTQADRISHAIIVHALERKYAGDLPIHSEESTNDGVVDLSDDEVRRHLANCDRYQTRESDLNASMDEIDVWVDPLDATQEYSGSNRHEKYLINFKIIY